VDCVTEKPEICFWPVPHTAKKDNEGDGGESSLETSPPFRTNDGKVGNTLGFSARGGNQCTEGASSRPAETHNLLGEGWKTHTPSSCPPPNECQRMYTFSPRTPEVALNLLRNQNKMGFRVYNAFDI
jgi:hypothetical protein